MEAIEVINPADDLAVYEKLTVDDQERLRWRVIVEHFRAILHSFTVGYIWVLVCNLADNPIQAVALYEKQIPTSEEIARIAKRLNRPVFGVYRQEISGRYTL